MYCPQCLTDYRAGFFECADCRVRLLPGEAPAKLPVPEWFPALVGVLDTNDGFALASACTALDEAEIIYDVIDIAEVPENVKPVHPNYWIRPSRILVASEEEAEARELVERFQFPQLDFDSGPQYDPS